MWNRSNVIGSLHYGEMLPVSRTSGNGKWGFIDRKGRLAIDFKWDYKPYELLRTNNLWSISKDVSPENNNI